MAIHILPDDFKELLKLFNKHRVKYLLIGGYAVAHYGYVRATQDMDLWISIVSSNAAKTVKALVEFGFDSSALSEDIFLKPHQVIRMGVPPLRIEILTTISGVQFDLCYERRKEISIEGILIPIIDVEDLKVNKKAAGRHSDLNDLENLV
ncbi:nucleotidyltransferase [bacterium]|nr:nucleotidyltransferase [bacterium]